MAPVALGVCVAVIGFVIELTPAAQRWNGDLRLYHQYTGALLRGTLSDTDFLRQYPPLALAPLALPQLVALGGAVTFPLYAAVYTLLAAGGAGAGLAILRRALASQSRAGVAAQLVLYAGLCLAATALIVARFDIWPMLAVLVAMGAMGNGAGAAGRAWTTFVAGAALGIGFALKVYPAMLLPVLLVWCLRSGGARVGLAALGGFVVAAGVGLAPYLAFPQGGAALIAFQLHRPIQLESVWGSVLGLIGSMGDGPVQVAFGSGSFNVAGPMAAALGPLTGTAQLGMLAIAYAVAASCLIRGPQPPAVETAWRGMLIVLLALLLSSRVLSAQYVIWLIPLLAVSIGDRLSVFVASVAFILTAVLFPFGYQALTELRPWSVMLVVIRNLALGWLFVSLILRALDAESGQLPRGWLPAAPSARR